MAHPALLRNSIYLLSFVLFAGCNTPANTSISTKQVNAVDTTLRIMNGVMYESGQLFTGTVYTLHPGTKDTAELANYFQGKENGEWKKFYAPGALKEKREFTNGKKTGEYIAYWENGNKKLDYLFDDDEYEGTCREWNADGMLIREMNYKKGHEEGEQKMFYDNGSTRSNYIIVKGRRYGLLGTKNCINVSDSVFQK